MEEIVTYSFYQTLSKLCTPKTPIKDLIWCSHVIASPNQIYLLRHESRVFVAQTNNFWIISFGQLLCSSLPTRVFIFICTVIEFGLLEACYNNYSPCSHKHQCKRHHLTGKSIADLRRLLTISSRALGAVICPSNEDVSSHEVSECPFVVQ